MRLPRNPVTGLFPPGAYRKSPCGTSPPVVPGKHGRPSRDIESSPPSTAGVCLSELPPWPYHGSPQGTSSPAPYLWYLRGTLPPHPGCIAGLPKGPLPLALPAITPWDSHPWYGWGVSVGNPSPGPIGGLPTEHPVPRLLPASLPPRRPVPGAC